MQYLPDNIETEAKIVGAEAHSKLIEDTAKVKREEL
jgi:hypothetical protein